jgi:putative transcriptional regulator
MICHHPDDATLLAYAAGAVTEGFSLVVAAHLERCGRCRGRVAEAECVGGRLLEGLGETPLTEGALGRLYARIDGQMQREAGTEPPPQAPEGVPRVLARWLPRGLADVRWRTLLPGVRDFRLTGVHSARGTARLLSIAPATTIPHHGHSGSELTLVLKGSYMDEIGRFQRGDVADLAADVEHQPVTDTAETCICLVATDAPLRFSGVLGRVIQPFVGI